MNTGVPATGATDLFPISVSVICGGTAPRVGGGALAGGGDEPCATPVSERNIKLNLR